MNQNRAAKTSPTPSIRLRRFYLTFHKMRWGRWTYAICWQERRLTSGDTCARVTPSFSRLNPKRTAGTLLPVLAIALLVAAPLYAQSTSTPPKEENEEKIKKTAVGVHISFAGAQHWFHIFPASGVDDLAVPILGASFRYNAYQGFLITGRDDNESSLRLTGRYNLGLKRQLPHNARARIYPYGGVDLWYFNRRRIIPYDPFPDRPFGKSTTFGFNAGLGMEFGSGAAGVSIEGGIAYRLCSRAKYDDFICYIISDFKVGFQAYF